MPGKRDAREHATMRDVTSGRQVESRHESLGHRQQAVVVLFVVAALAYFPWRWSTFNPNAPLFSGVVYGAELLGCLLALLHLFVVWRLPVRDGSAPAPGLVVDVFVTTLNEPVDVVRRTLVAATRMRYPHLTWLLDDGNRPEMRALAVELDVRYLNRPHRRHARAGNLNHALRRTLGDFIAVFEADQVPARDFLLRTLGQFEDPRLGFVTTAHACYNLDSFQHGPRDRVRPPAWHEQSQLQGVVQRGRDWHGAAQFLGTGAVLRRQALRDIGGFAVDAVAEDLETSVRLHRRGWRSVHLPEPLVVGCAPVDPVPFLRLRLRAAQAAMQALRRHRGFLLASGLTFAQRLSYLAGVLAYFDGWKRAVWYCTPACILLTGVLPVATVSPSLLAAAALYHALAFWALEEGGRGYRRGLDEERLAMARCAVFILGTLALLRRRLPFRAPDKRRRWGRHPVARRLLLPPLLVLTLNAGAIPIGVALRALKITGLPMLALAVSLAWAIGNATTASALLRFARRLAGYRRGDYRFPIPLPAMLDHVTAAPQAGILDDVSAEGFRYYGPFPAAVRVGDAITGDLLLPAGRLRFRAMVRHRYAPGSDGEPRSLGCRFDWAHPGDGHELLAFLYGSDLQARLHRLAERSMTPIARLGRRPEPSDDRTAGPHWAAAVCRSHGVRGETHVGIVSVPAIAHAERTLVAFRRLGAREVLNVLVSSRTGTRMLDGDAVLCDAMMAAGRPLYVYRFTPTSRGLRLR